MLVLGAGTEQEEADIHDLCPQVSQSMDTSELELIVH